MATYENRGVSPHKPDVKKAVNHFNSNIFPGAFCWVIEDILGGDPEKCLISHADGAGTKSSLAYLYYLETGDVSVFRGIGQDSLAMNLNDMIAVGTTGPFVLSNTIGRNSKNIPGEVISEILLGYKEQCEMLAEHGIIVTIAGGETADLGDIVRTVVVDSTLTTLMMRSDIIDLSKVSPKLDIIGVSSFGQSSYEKEENSGVGTNGFSSLRHDILSKYYIDKYPESFAPEIAEHAYVGRFRISDQFPMGNGTVADYVLSPTRIYAPIVKSILENCRTSIRGIVNNSGGGQTKCMNFGNNIHYNKFSPIKPPVVFDFIREESSASLHELGRTYNLGCMLEIICDPSATSEILDIISRFGVHAQKIGETEESTEGQQVSLTLWDETCNWSSDELN